MAAAHEARPAINPFVLAGEDEPTRPLCPWRYPDDEHYYVDVNHTREAFTRFGMRIPARPTRQDARLVLAVGPTGCGKTALLNRCVHELALRSEETSRRPVIVDLTGTSGSWLRTRDRMNLVRAVLVDELAQQLGGSFQHVADGPDDHDLFYARLMRSLDPHVMPLVVLPPADDLVAEIKNYVRLARHGIHFFTESAYLTENDVAGIQNASVSSPPLVLRVGDLNPGDVRRFVTDRLKRNAGAGRYPRVSEEAMDWVSGPRQSIRMVQWLLYAVYQDRLLNRARYGGDELVTREDITEFLSARGSGDLEASR